MYLSYLNIGEKNVTLQNGLVTTVRCFFLFIKAHINYTSLLRHSQEFLFHYLKARQQNNFFYLMGFLCLHHSRLSKKRRIGKAKSVYINDIHI